MNLHIKDKFELADLVRAGSQARRYVRPRVMIADATDGVFAEGDMIDANATNNLVKDTIKSLEGGIKLIIMTQEEYNELEEYEPHTVYFITEE